MILFRNRMQEVIQWLMCVVDVTYRYSRNRLSNSVFLHPQLLRSPLSLNFYINFTVGAKIDILVKYKKISDISYKMNFVVSLYKTEGAYFFCPKLLSILSHFSSNCYRPLRWAVKISLFLRFGLSVMPNLKLNF